jgi:hypothetical protein
MHPSAPHTHLNSVRTHADLGFDDCSSPVIALPDASGPDPVTAAVTGHPPTTWHFFNFSVAEADQNVVVMVTADKPTTSA